MMTKQEIYHYQSFLLRLWQVKETDGFTAWYGEVESIQTGQKWEFAAPEAMFDFLWAQLDSEPAKQSEK